jgi:hypothetical protein
MSWRDASYLLALALLVIAIVAALLAEKPAMRDFSRFLWGVAIVSTVGILTYLAVSVTWD